MAVLLMSGCAGGGSSGSGQRAGVDLDNPDESQEQWKEDTPPAPPAYDMARLIDLDTPVGADVKVGIDPKTITIDPTSGVVRFVVVARGSAAVNAMYEGIRCPTGEFRIYARQVRGQPWSQVQDSGWRSIKKQTGALLRHPYQLAEGGICDGTTTTSTVDQMIYLLRSKQLRPDWYQ